MTDKRPTSNHDFNAMVAKVMADLMDEAATRPASIEVLRAATEKDKGRELARGIFFALVPRRVDGESWCNWLEGGPVPEPVKRIDPDWIRIPKTSGAQKSAATRRDDAAREVARLKEQLDAAQKVLDGRERELEEADHRMRALLVFRLLQQVVREGAGVFAMGPLYTVARAISPYLQRDPEWEVGLSEDDALKVDDRRKSRRAESIEILDGLDRLAGDERLELNLHRAILRAVRERLKWLNAEVAARREKGVASTKRMKLQAVRRSLEEQKSGFHEAAPLADRSDVFDAFDGLDEFGEGDALGEGNGVDEGNGLEEGGDGNGLDTPDAQGG